MKHLAAVVPALDAALGSGVPALARPAADSPLIDLLLGKQATAVLDRQGGLSAIRSPLSQAIAWTAARTDCPGG